MPASPSCPRCGLDDTCPDGSQLVCPHCAHEWAGEEAANAAVERAVVRDCNGNPLAQGDSVVVIKDLKVRGSSIPLRQGSVIRNLRRVPEDAEHIEGNSDKIQGTGAQELFLRKVGLDPCAWLVIDRAHTPSRV